MLVHLYMHKLQVITLTRDTFMQKFDIIFHVDAKMSLC